MLKVAITGGIGSGKSYVAKKFQKLGIPVYFADKEAKRLMSYNDELKLQIKAAFGKEAYHNNGRLNRPYLAQQIFTNKDKLKTINNLVHPAVKKDFEKWSESQNAEYVLEESAIVFENNLDQYFDKIILVIADKEERIKRVMQRDKVDRKSVLLRIDKQLSDKKKIPLANFVIENNPGSNLENSISTIHKKLIKI